MNQPPGYPPGSSPWGSAPNAAWQQQPQQPQQQPQAAPFGYPPQQQGYPQQQAYPQQPQGYPPQQPYPQAAPFGQPATGGAFSAFGAPQQMGMMAPAAQVPQKTEWKWHYSKYVGVMYGPIPVGVIVVAIGYIVYYSVA